MSRLITNSRSPYDGAAELPRKRRSGARNRTPASRILLILLLAAVYIPFGMLHLSAPNSMLPIMPPGLPFPKAIILFTGGCEIAGGIGLLIPLTRKLAAVMLSIYAVCVWPANLYHAFWHVHVAPLPDSWWYHGPRLAFQLVLIWWPLFAAEVIDWPFGSRRR